MEHIFQQLSLVLKSLGTVSNTHLRLVVVELLYCQGFSKGVGQVLLFIDLLKVNVTSIHDLPDQVEAMQNVLHPLVCFEFLRLSYGTSAVTIEQDRTIEGGCYFELDDEFSQPPAFFAASDAAMYSASQTEFATVCCLELFQQIAPPFRVKI